jgi:hypothetical protein
MTVKVSSDNKSGETRVPVKVGPQSGTNVIDLDQEAGFIIEQNARVRQLDDVYQRLPAKQASDPNINFLGSSYSGTDIKVIAHLYDTVNWRDKEITDLELQKAIADSVVNGGVSLLTGGGFARFADAAANDVLTFTERRTVFIQATGLSENDEAEQQALKILLGAVFGSGNFSFLGVARMRIENEALVQSYTARSLELEGQIGHLKEIESESSSTIALGTLQTFSISSHREKSAVRALGHSYAKGYTRGPRTLAGSMIFTIFDEHPLLKLIRAMGISRHYGDRDTELSTLLPDQLPPIDLTIVFANEYGSLSDFRLYGIEFVNDGATYSIEDLLSEEIINFVARDADVMTSRGNVRISRLQTGKFNETDDKDINGSSLLFDNNSYNQYLEKLKVRRRIKNR